MNVVYVTDLASRRYWPAMRGLVAHGGIRLHFLVESGDGDEVRAIYGTDAEVTELWPKSLVKCAGKLVEHVYVTPVRVGASSAELQIKALRHGHNPASFAQLVAALTLHSKQSLPKGDVVHAANLSIARRSLLLREMGILPGRIVCDILEPDLAWLSKPKRAKPFFDAVSHLLVETEDLEHDLVALGAPPQKIVVTNEIGTALSGKLMGVYGG